MMHIEDISPSTLKHANNSELKVLRFRFIQLWENFYAQGKTVGDMTEDEFVGRYRMLRRVMHEHGVEIVNATGIDRELFKRSMGFLGSADMGDLVIVENYVSLGGSYVRDPKGAGDVDVIIRARESARDEGMELKLGRALHKETAKECHFVYAPAGPHSSYIPIYDLVLRERPQAKVVRVDEAEIRKAARDYYEGLERGDAELKAGNEAAVAALAPGSVVDVGCGSGLLLRRLEDEGREIYGVDLDPTAVAMCREKGVAADKMDVAGGLPWRSAADASWDNILFVHSLEHMQDPALLVVEAGKLARKRVVVVAPLGERADPGHKHTWATLDDFKAVFAGQWEVNPVPGTRSAIAVLDKEALEKRALKPDMMGNFPLPKPSMTGLTETFTVDEIWPWCEKRI